jgi:hypothetical protein
MRRILSGCILAILGLAALTAGADDFWVKKDWKTWSKSECKKMLEDSPWAKRILVENNATYGQLPYAGATPSSNPGASVGSAGSGEVSYFVQILSAAPIREAIIRQQQIEQKYDMMSNSEKNAFDAKMDQQIDGMKSDAIYIRVVIEANKPELGEGVAAAWQNVAPNTIPMGVYLLTENGGRVTPLMYSFVKGEETEFDVTFPRNAGGGPVIAGNAKSVKVQFVNPAIGDFPEKTVTVEYKLDKMMWNGKVVY